MPNLSTWGKHPTPTPPEDNKTPADLMALVESLDPHTVQFANSLADRNARFNGLPAGGKVSCAALATEWMSLGGSPTTQWYTVSSDTGWVSAGFTYPDSDWVAGSYAQVRSRNGTTEVRAAVQLSGLPITANAFGDFPTPSVITLPVGFRPGVRGVTGRGFYSSNGLGVSFLVNPSGAVQLVDTQPDAVMITGGEFRFSATWLEG